MEVKLRRPLPKFNNLMDVIERFPDESSCREYLEQARWGDTIICVHCDSENVSKYKSRPVYWCKDCDKQFSVKVGTIFEDSALPLRKWFFAIFLITAHKKGISSLQLAKDIKVTQKTAWYMLHRIRYAVRTSSFAKPLSNIVEVDETYIGGKHSGKRGRGSENKTAVFGMVERAGKLRSMSVENVKASTLQNIIKGYVAKGTTVMSDEWLAYKRLSQYFDHHVVSHGKQEYSSGNVHVNTIEGFWSIFKRGIYGIYHHVSPKHLDRYIHEFQFRYNTRELGDSVRFLILLNYCTGRLTYEELKNEDS